MIPVKPYQLRTPDRLRPAIPGRPAVAQHLAHRLAGQPEAARRRALAQSLHIHAAPHRRIRVPLDTSLLCSTKHPWNARWTT